MAGLCGWELGCGTVICRWFWRDETWSTYWNKTRDVGPRVQSSARPPARRRRTMFYDTGSVDRGPTIGAKRGDAQHRGAWWWQRHARTYSSCREFDDLPLPAMIDWERKFASAVSCPVYISVCVSDCPCVCVCVCLTSCRSMSQTVAM